MIPLACRREVWADRASSWASKSCANAVARVETRRESLIRARVILSLEPGGELHIAMRGTVAGGPKEARAASKAHQSKAHDRTNTCPSSTKHPSQKPLCLEAEEW